MVEEQGLAQGTAQSAELQGSVCRWEIERQLPAPPGAASSQEGRAAVDGGLSQEQVLRATEPRARCHTPWICLGKWVQSFKSLM